MKLVIDIDGELCDALINGYEEPYSRQFSECVKNATPLTDCTDAISRSAVMELVTADWKYEGLEKDILSLPSVNPTRPKAKWIGKEITEDYRVRGLCSNCRQRRLIDHYCPNCGAEMESDSDA